MRIAFTGGSGKAGRHVVKHLAEQGHRVLNLDLVPSKIVGVFDLVTDLMDAGQVFSALSGIACLDELDRSGGIANFDAVVHFAAIPRIQIKPDTECFRINTTTTYNVLEVATKLKIPKILLASSETTYGVCFAHEEVKPTYFPVDEEHPTLPHDAYAMSKVCNELCGQSFHARTGADIYAMRINNVVEPHEYVELVPRWKSDPACRRRNIFAYIDTRDLSDFVDRALAVDGLGYQVFNVANSDSAVELSSHEIIATYYKDVPQKQELGESETFYSIDKARKLLGFSPASRWRQF
ncbi:MAG: NAD(P)-dependent oxidoreductase [Planctomycetales bacterium]|nr:NAD(P)-dependent oxidoreductase [Planctomycetales bacterium]